MPAPLTPDSFTLVRFAEPGAFAALAEPFMLEREAANCLQLGLMPAVVDGRFEYVYQAVLEGPDGEVVMVALQTPPNRLILTDAVIAGSPVRGSDDAATAAVAEALVRGLLEPTDGQPVELPGVLGPVALAEAFARAWGERNGVPVRRTVQERVYVCTEVAPVGGVPGTMVKSGLDQLDLLVDLVARFREEALPYDPPSTREQVETTVRRDLASPDGGLWLWEHDGRVVSLAGARGVTRNGIRVGPVYTPPELRGHGYASALTAFLTSHLLASGHRHVTLFTNLANPTSNAIYQRIGYVPVTDRDVYEFGQAVG